MKIIKMIITTPTKTPIAAHFPTLLLDSSCSALTGVVGVIGVAGLKKNSTSEMFAPIAVSMSDL